MAKKKKLWNKEKEAEAVQSLESALGESPKRDLSEANKAIENHSKFDKFKKGAK